MINQSIFQYESDLENPIEVNNYLKLNVDEQQEYINHLKEQYDIDYED